MGGCVVEVRLLPCYRQIMGTVSKELEIITRSGKPVAVILPIKEYEKLLSRLEDAEDSACLEKARRKPLSFRPLDDHLAETKKVRV